MGIFSPSKQRYAPPSETVPTMLGAMSPDDPVTASSDLNRAPPTSVELRFRHYIADGKELGVDRSYDSGFDHAYIVVTDNATQRQWVHQAGPSVHFQAMPPSLFSLQGSTDEYTPTSTGYGQRYTPVAKFSTELPAEDVRKKLEAFQADFNEKAIPYQLPDLRIPFVPPSRNPLFATRNSNFYGGAAWERLTGTLPDLPSEVDAPGWGDHRIRSPGDWQ